MSAPRAIRGCAAFWAVALALTFVLIVLVNLVDYVAHARGWW